MSGWDVRDGEPDLGGFLSGILAGHKAYVYPTNNSLAVSFVDSNDAYLGRSI